MAKAERPNGAQGGGSSAGGGSRPPRRKRSGFTAFLYWSAVAGVWGLIFLVAFLAVFARGLPDTSKLYDIQRQPSISYLDRNGALIAMRGSQQAPPADIDSLPPYVPAAFVSIEDRRFYSHPGFDPVGIARALVADIRCRCSAEGASTITQQLARNLFLSPDQNIRRKVQELILAVWLEYKFSKKQILALYMNRVNFGAGAYGLEAASQRYFNKPAQQLTVGEAAMLAGLLKAPSRYSPVSDSERAARRATIVLDSMVATRAITPAQRDEAFAHPVRVTRTLASQHAQYFIDWVDTQARKIVGDAADQDLVVETTLDLSLNAAAQNAARSILTREEKTQAQQAAVVALDGAGRVRVLLGGIDYSQSQYNRAIDARRQAGSAFKPFVYLTAMEAGLTPDTPVVDEPVTIGNWTPQNYTQKYLGPITLQTAVAQSINTVAARIADEIGRDNVARTAHRMGITSKVGTDPSMALGAVEVSPLEMAQAYAPFANGGQLATAYGIERIRTKDGRVLYEHKAETRTSVVGNPALSEMNQMLRAVVVGGGTGGRAAVGGYDLAGKTGTTSDYRDAWFVGYTGGFVAAVWVGKDDNTPMRRVTGGTVPAEVWHGFMTAALPRLQVRPIPAGPAAQVLTADPIGDLIDQAQSAMGGEIGPPAEGAQGPAPIEPLVPPPGTPAPRPDEAPLF